jgi:hypothetical protein
MSKGYIIDLSERVVSTFVVTYIGAVTVLPGGIWSAHNWQISLAAAAGSTVKGLVAKQIGNKNSASLAPNVLGGAAGGAAGAALGGAVGSAVGGVAGGLGQAVEDVVQGLEGKGKS